MGYNNFFSILLIIAACASGCHKDDTYVAKKAPVSVTDFSPTRGVYGDEVFINGANFSANPSDNVVLFNGAMANVTSATSTRLTVVIPEGATTGKISIASNSGTPVITSVDFVVDTDIPRIGLVAFYPFSGTLQDKSGNNLDGSSPSASTTPSTTSDRFGNPAHAYLFDGIDDFITMHNPPALQLTTSMTVAGWFKFKSFNNFGSSALITKIFFNSNLGNNPDGGYYISQSTDGGGNRFFNIAAYSADGTSLTISRYVGSPLNLDEWFFVAYVFDNDSFTFYQNAEKKYEETNNETVIQGGNGLLGDLEFGTYGQGFQFNGVADDIVIYNRALSQPEVQQLFRQNITSY